MRFRLRLNFIILSGLVKGLLLKAGEPGELDDELLYLDDKLWVDDLVESKTDFLPNDGIISPLSPLALQSPLGKRKGFTNMAEFFGTSGTQFTEDSGSVGAKRVKGRMESEPVSNRMSVSGQRRKKSSSKSSPKRSSSKTSSTKKDPSNDPFASIAEKVAVTVPLRVRKTQLMDLFTRDKDGNTPESISREGGDTSGSRSDLADPGSPQTKANDPPEQSGASSMSGSSMSGSSMSGSSMSGSSVQRRSTRHANKQRVVYTCFPYDDDDPPKKIRKGSGRAKTQKDISAAWDGKESIAVMKRKKKYQYKGEDATERETLNLQNHETDLDMRVLGARTCADCGCMRLVPRHVSHNADWIKRCSDMRDEKEYHTYRNGHDLGWKSFGINCATEKNNRRVFLRKDIPNKYVNGRWAKDLRQRALINEQTEDEVIGIECMDCAKLRLVPNKKMYRENRVKCGDLGISCETKESDTEQFSYVV